MPAQVRICLQVQLASVVPVTSGSVDVHNDGSEGESLSVFEGRVLKRVDIAHIVELIARAHASEVIERTSRLGPRCRRGLSASRNNGEGANKRCYYY